MRSGKQRGQQRGWDAIKWAWGRKITILLYARTITRSKTGYNLATWLRQKTNKKRAYVFDVNPCPVRQCGKQDLNLHGVTPH